MAAPISAQLFSYGVKGGIRTIDVTTGAVSSESKRYIVGPMLDVRLPFGIGVEVDALYQRFGFTSQFQNSGASDITRERANAWEFPVIAKYRLSTPLLHPYASIGYAPRIISGSDVSSGADLAEITSTASIFTHYSNQRTSTDYLSPMASSSREASMWM